MLGRSKKHSVVYFDQDKTLSRKHGKFEMNVDGHFYYTDIKSGNGSWVKLKP